MGEFAKYRGTEIKIGTCENMYYLRADQAALVTPVPNSLDPIAESASIRFRFPFPDEDNCAPGEFGPRYDRGASLNMTCPDDVEHGSIQFHAEPGYLISLPCPESKEARTTPTLKFHKNGWPGGTVSIVQQRCLEGVRMLVCKCVGCGERWRVPTLDEARPYVRACLALSAELDSKARLLGYPESQRLTWAHEAEFWAKMGERIEAGYEPGCGSRKGLSAA